MCPRGVPSSAGDRLDGDRGKELVTTYAANPIGKFKPKDHYLDWVLKGLRQWKFPENVIQQWESYRPR